MADRGFIEASLSFRRTNGRCMVECCSETRGRWTHPQDPLDSTCWTDLTYSAEKSFDLRPLHFGTVRLLFARLCLRRSSTVPSSPVPFPLSSSLASRADWGRARQSRAWHSPSPLSLHCAGRLALCRAAAGCLPAASWAPYKRHQGYATGLRPGGPSWPSWKGRPGARAGQHCEWEL